MYLKEMLLLSYHSSEVLRFKFVSNYLLKSFILKILFTSPVRVRSFFTFKDKLSKMLLPGLVYQYNCGGCNATHYGRTKYHFKVRICEHLGISRATEKR